MKTTAKRQAVKPPVPDVKSATREMLARVADWVDTEAGWPVLGVQPARRSKEEWAALEEARKLAAGYIRMGAR